jgi:uncharacterized alpha-E superfamily protein
MLSRIADSLFWLGRYVERAVYTARILDVNYHMLLEQSQQPFRLHWEPLIVMAGEQERFAKSHREANAQTVFDFLAFETENPSSIVQCITKARENARTIRDRISREMWEDINGLFHKVRRFQPAEEIAVGPHRFHGVADDTLPHDEGWHFLQAGRAQQPRSIRFNIAALQGSLAAISSTAPGRYANEAERLTGKLHDTLLYDRIEEIFARGLHPFLVDLQRTCRAIGEHIARTYFYYAVAG